MKRNLALLFLVLTLIPSGVGASTMVHVLGSTATTLAALVLAARLFGQTRILERVLEGLSTPVRACERILIESDATIVLVALSAGLGILAITLNVALFERLPHVFDSVAGFFHSKLIASGRLWIPSHPLPRFFDMLHVINDGKWYSQYPPGHLVFLAIGHLLGAPWLVNPVLAALTVPAIYWLGKESLGAKGEKTARLAALLFCLSPFVWFLSAEFMSHATALLFLTLAMALFFRMLRIGSPQWAALSGACLGWVFITRPLTAVALIVPMLVFGLSASSQKKKSCALAFALGLSLFVAAQAGFNHATTGSALRFGYNAAYGPHVGFGVSPAGDVQRAWLAMERTPRPEWTEADTPHTPWIGIRHAVGHLNGLQRYLFEWPVASLLPVFLLFLFRFKPNPDSGVYLLLLGTVASVAAAHVFHGFWRWTFGPRFLYETTGALVILTAAGVGKIPDALSALPRRLRLRQTRELAALFMAALFIVGYAVHLPGRLREYGPGFYSTRGDILAEVDRMGLKNAIVFVTSWYGNVFTRNPPLPNSDVIFARDKGSENAQLAKMYPGRLLYRERSGRIEPWK